MTPRRLERDSVHSKLMLMRELLEDLEDLRDRSADQLQAERLTRRALERILTQLVDLAAVASYVSRLDDR